PGRSHSGSSAAPRRCRIRSSQPPGRPGHPGRSRPRPRKTHSSRSNNRWPLPELTTPTREIRSPRQGTTASSSFGSRVYVDPKPLPEKSGIYRDRRGKTPNAVGLIATKQRVIHLGQRDGTADLGELVTGRNV